MVDEDMEMENETNVAGSGTRPRIHQQDLVNGVNGVNDTYHTLDDRLQRPVTQQIPPSRQASKETNEFTSNIIGQLTLNAFDDFTDQSSDDELASGSLPKPHGTPISTLRTGLCYDTRMRFHCELSPSRNQSDYHPEDPRRIYHIFRGLCDAGLVEDPTTKQIVPKPLYRISARYATKSEICLVHDRAHFDNIATTRGASTMIC